MRPRVLIFGCGPAGLIAAHAAKREFNAEVMIVSRKRKSELFGCQYLHEPIPGISEDKGELVKYQLDGSVADYRQKVYGSLTPPVSPQKYVGDHMAWDIRAAYDRLWEMYEIDVNDVNIYPNDVVPMLSHFMPQVVVSSVPLPVLCQMGDQHNFSSVPCWGMGDAPELGQHVPYVVPPFHVVCSGLPDYGWYRASNVFGHSTIEWPGHKRRPPIEGVVAVKKPLTNNCDCMPSVLRVGRYGMWSKGVLSHEAYAATVLKIQEMAAV